MKILLVNKFHYRKGGSETYYFTLAESLMNRGHEVVYFAMEDEKNFPCEQAQYFVSNVDYNNGGGVLNKAKAALKLIYSKESKDKMEQLIHAEKPDLAIFNLVHRQISLSIVDALNKYNIPIMFVMHDLICACPNYTMLSGGMVCEKCLGKHFINCVKNKCTKDSTAKSVIAMLEANYYLFKKTYNKIDTYITPSGFYRKKLDQARFTKSPIIHRKNLLPINTVYELPQKVGNYILFFGRLSQEKGILTLIEAMKKVKSDDELWLLGNGPQKEELKRYIVGNQLGAKVKLLGFKTGEELQTIVAESKAVVLPSEWYENGPYSVMEAMSKGRPVIASNIGGLPELVEDGVTGYVFESKNANDLSDKMNKLLELDEETYIQMSKAAIEKAKADFNPDNYVDFIICEYNKIISKRGK
ncbi:glycosyltransferase [Desulfosporosinus sp. BG]|uniref:glycosyltransferase n=1 Tax=Desulfosporosinus sp. BG TaxID=1633135 RepID=UPI00083AD3B5|nr:glycosyltransferase [Desulfosporosinus sp. BG]ODA40301.1 putative glycosyltransferase protein [Desulfosporosinus sp. BG]